MDVLSLVYGNNAPETFYGASALRYIFISGVKFALTEAFYSALSEAMLWQSLGTLFKVETDNTSPLMI